MLTMIIGWSRMDKFSDTPKFSSTLKPMRATMVPTHSVDDFVKSMADAKNDADKPSRKARRTAFSSRQIGAASPLADRPCGSCVERISLTISSADFVQGGSTRSD